MKFLPIIVVTAFFCQLSCANFTVDTSSPDRRLRRGKRYLDFIAKSRMFFRANVKDNVIKVNTLWAHAFGFRANYPIENDKKYRPFRRDVVETVEELLNRHGLDGQACSLNAFCEALHMVPSESKMVFKLFKLIFTLEEHDLLRFPHLDKKLCGLADQSCPLTFNNISPFTDEF